MIVLGVGFIACLNQIGVPCWLALLLCCGLSGLLEMTLSLAEFPIYAYEYNQTNDNMDPWLGSIADKGGDGKGAAGGGKTNRSRLASCGVLILLLESFSGIPTVCTLSAACISFMF